MYVTVQEFQNAMKLRFAMIDVTQSQKDAKKSNADVLLDIHNELKLITAPDDVFDLWSEVISSAGAGELIDPDTGLKFKAKTNWNPESGNLTREFFKWLGNLTYEDLAKLARHILNVENPKWTLRLSKGDDQGDLFGSREVLFDQGVGGEEEAEAPCQEGIAQYQS